MSDLANSGIYVVEGLSKGQAIPVRRETVVAFLGSSPRGPVGIPIKIGSVDEYQKRFGLANEPSRLLTALTQFFDNGAASGIVVRVCHSTRRNQIRLPGPSGPLVLSATNPGPMEYLRASVDYDGIDATDRNRFNLVIHRLASSSSPIVEEQEIHNGLSVNPASPNYAAHVLLGSELVFVDAGIPGQRPECTLAPGIEVGKSYVYANADWETPDGITDYDLIGSEADGTGLSALQQLPVVDYVCPVPDSVDLGPVAMFAAERYCLKRYAILAIDPPSAWTGVVDVAESVRRDEFSSANVLTYYPRPVNSGEHEPASAIGGILGRLAAVEAEHGVWHSFSGNVGKADRLAINYRAELPVHLDGEHCAALARKGVNSLCDTGDGALELHGLVTFARGEGVGSARNALRSRRITLFIVESIARATRWTAFEDGDGQVWSVLDNQLREFLRTLYVEEAIVGETEENAFYVLMDRDAGDRHGRITFLVGFAISNNEFYAFRFIHDRVDCEVREIARRAGIALAS